MFEKLERVSFGGFCGLEFATENLPLGGKTA